MNKGRRQGMSMKLRSTVEQLEGDGYGMDELSSGSEVEDDLIYEQLMTEVECVAEARRRKAESQSLTAAQMRKEGSFDLPY